MSSPGSNSPPTKSPAEQLQTPVQFLKGVGEKRARLLHRLNLHTALDLLFFFPRDYQDMSELVEIADLQDDQAVSVTGEIAEVDIRNTGPGRCIVGALLKQGDEHLRAVWFNQPFMADRLRRGQTVMFSGNPRRRGTRWEMPHPKVQWLDDTSDAQGGQIQPVYPLTDGLNQHQIRRIVRSVVQSHASLIPEVFPEDFRHQHQLATIHEALPQVHFPDSAEALDQARRRFIYQELLALQLALATRKNMLTIDAKAVPLPLTGKIDARIRRLLPFELTPGQEKAIAEITADMTHPHPMNRLLQGEVGSGKTVVAVFAMLVAVAHRQQAAIMAPTEVLARQHQRTFERMLAGSQVRMGLLTGSLSAPQRREMIAAIAAGEIDLVIGTHAVVQEDVEFARLGLVVIDEQHKFGVRQRAQLKQHELDPHYLVMTATPIPRTMAMSFYGDLDVSTIRDGPPGRQPVHSYLVLTGDEVAASGGRESAETGKAPQPDAAPQTPMPSGERQKTLREVNPSPSVIDAQGKGSEAARAQWWDFFRRKLRQGRQGFVITPLVEESEAIDAANVQAAFESLANGELADFRLDLVHGRMSAEEKDDVMTAFADGTIDVLVATSVVEVGVDVPNATLMAIEDGQRFGLAQLHQLRGRVSRGSHPGFVCVFANDPSDESKARLEAFTESTDGFELAEIDYRLRGPGDLLGTRQHGLPPLRIADLHRDTELLATAREDAQKLIADRERWESDAFALLRNQVSRRYEAALNLGDVG